MAWNNKDGLLQRFGTERSAVRVDGRAPMNTKTLVYKIADASALGDTDTAAPAADEAFLPNDAVITKATFIVTTAFTSGGSAVLDLGLKTSTGTNTDDDGIDAAVAVAALTADAVIECDGALVASKLAADGYIMATYDTAAFTAGAGTLVVEYLEV